MLLPVCIAASAASATDPPVASAQSAPAPAEAPWRTGYDDGFFLRSPDGRFEFSIAGRMQFDGLLYGPERDPQSDFLVRRLRLEFSGRFPGGMRFRLEPNFLPGGTEIEEGWLGFDTFDGRALAMFGRMKAPFGLEERNPQANVDFPRFSILHQFSPAEQQGVFLYGHTASEGFGYDLAVYNGSDSSDGSDTNDSKDVAARGVWRPCATREGSAMQHLQFGVAATFGTENDDLTGDSIDNETQLPVLRYVDDLHLDGQRTRFGLEGAWFHGPWLVQTEWMRVDQEMALASDAETVSYTGAYLTISHVLTGEDRSFGATKPFSPCDLEKGGGRGAWILAARLSQLDTDSDLESAGFVEPGTFTDRIRTASLGLDWVPNEFVILRHALVHSWYDRSVELDDGSASSEDAFLVELQVSF